MLSLYYTGPYLLIMAFAFLASYLLTPLISKFALGRRQLPTPLGGISIYLAFVLSLIILTFWLRPGCWATEEFRNDVFNPIYGILIGGGLIFLVGLISDIKKLSPSTVLIAQIASALILISFGISITIYHLPFSINFLLSILWVILIVNAFRIVSVVNGLSAGIAIVATIPFFVIGWRNMNAPVILTSCALASATFGFLRYSFPPSRASLGKAGSMFLGFVIAAVAMAENYTRRNLSAFLIAPLFILAIPLYDTAVRLLKRKLTTPRSKKQFARHLMDIGFSTKETLIIVYFIAFILGVSAFLVTYSSPTWALALSFWIGAAFIGLIYQLNQSPAKALTSYVNEIKRLIFAGGLSETEASKSPSDVKNLLKGDFRLACWLLTDIILVNMGIYIGYLIRFNGVIDPKAFQPYLHLWYFLTIAHLVIFTIFKLYYHPNRFSKIEVIVRTIKAVTLATIASVCIVYIYRFTEGAFPCLVFVSTWLVNIILVGGWRVFIRYEV